MSEDAVRVDPTRRPSAGAGGPGGLGASSVARRSGSGLPVPTELIVLVVTALAVLIATAAADNFEAPSAWTLVTVLSVAYILSRGFAKYERRGEVVDRGV
jgi:hypothetical protein